MARKLNEGKRHELKCASQYYNAIKEGRKTAEIRENDRDYQTGDILELREVEHKTGNYVSDNRNERIYLDITHVLAGRPYLPDGYVMLSFADRMGVIGNDR